MEYSRVGRNLAEKSDFRSNRVTFDAWHAPFYHTDNLPAPSTRNPVLVRSSARSLRRLRTRKQKRKKGNDLKRKTTRPQSRYELVRFPLTYICLFLLCSFGWQAIELFHSSCFRDSKIESR